MDAYIEIAEAIKKDIERILADVLSGRNERYQYRTQSLSFIRWGLVQKDINERVDYHLTEN
jgi:hypothetical protein